MTDEREPIARVLAEHILFGYGSGCCACGVTFNERGRYSADHRSHVADVLISAGIGDKAAAWDEGVAVGDTYGADAVSLNPLHANPYRETGEQT